MQHYDEFNTWKMAAEDLNLVVRRLPMGYTEDMNAMPTYVAEGEGSGAFGEFTWHVNGSEIIGDGVVFESSEDYDNWQYSCYECEA